jgi:hypothetical protein
MVRTSAALAFLVALSGATRVASAEEVKECVESGSVVSIGMSIVAPHEDLAHAESRDPMISFTFEARVDAVRREIERNDGVILWCMNPDDPRCSPVDASDFASLSSAALRHEAPETPIIRAPAANAVKFPPHESRAASGARTRLDRPPRA